MSIINNLSKPPIIYWDEKNKISYLQRVVIINSVLYYEKNCSIISDKEFDEVARKLTVMRSKKEYKESDYYYCMKDFDGTTGFDLYYRLKSKDKEIINVIVNSIIKSRRS